MDLSLCIFSTTKGNFHQTEIYKTVLEDLFNQFPREDFRDAWAHIKDGGESDAEEMAKQFSHYQITPVVTEGKYKHFNQSHADEYVKDVLKMAPLLRSRYTFFLEADWIFRSSLHSLDSFWEYVADALVILENQENLACMRFPHELYDKDIFHSQPAVFEPLNRKIHLNNHFYSLNPHIVKTSMLQEACKIIERYNVELMPLIEWKFTQAFHILSNGKALFGAFDPTEIRARHIGLPDWQNVLEGINKEYE